MVRDHIVVCDPSIDVNVLELGLRLRQRWAHFETSGWVSRALFLSFRLRKMHHEYEALTEHVVELLGIHVVQVAVSLEHVDASDGIEVFHLGSRFKVGDGLDERILVEVARRDDVGLGVLSQDCRNEILIEKVRQWESHELLKYPGEGMGEGAYCSNLGLCNAVLNATIHRGPRIAVDG